MMFGWFLCLSVHQPTNGFLAPTAEPSNLGPKNLTRLYLADIQVDLESHVMVKCEKMGVRDFDLQKTKEGCSNPVTNS